MTGVQTCAFRSGWGIAITGFGFASDPVVACTCLAVAGGADAISALFRSIIWNSTIPDKLRGRLASIEMLGYSTGPLLGNVESGAVAALWNVQSSVVSGGILGIIGCLICAALLPRFRQYDSRVTPSTNLPRSSEARPTHPDSPSLTPTPEPPTAAHA